jgi:hypothetical protein
MEIVVAFAAFIALVVSWFVLPARTVVADSAQTAPLHAMESAAA